MRTEYYFDSRGAGKIHVCRWAPEGSVKAVVQIVHGIAEHVLRYEEFAKFLNTKGILVVAQDHMGHGKSIDHGGTIGYFDGGWEAACADTVRLTKDTMAECPGVPYILFGHSMGSFMTRTILGKHPELGLAGCIICGTGWMPDGLLAFGHAAAKLICKKDGECNPSPTLQGIAFGNYNARVEHKRTDFDWLSRDSGVVDAYIADPMCGFIASGGLLRDMLGGMKESQQKSHLAKMNRKLPVLFIAGGEDPVGNYGKGVHVAAEHFRRAGMEDVSIKIYPLCRHEILNEINRMEIFEGIYYWISGKIQ